MKNAPYIVVPVATRWGGRGRSKDAEVIGVLNAQTQSAQQFARAQVTNFTDRLEQLHSPDGHRNAFNLRFNPTQAHARNKPGQAADSEQADLDLLAATQMLADDQPQLMHADPTDHDPTAPASGNVSVWTGGYVDFGNTERGASKVSSTLIGVSSGIDFRLSRALTAGVGVGYADVGNSTYTITTEGFGDDTLAASLGMDLLWASGLSTGIGYQGTRALGQQSRSDALSLRAAYRF